jgi:hypothetical protein
MIIMAQQSSWP